MDRLFREVLANADVRNANAGAGITITGTSDEVATISASQDIKDLIAAGILTATDSGVGTARQLVAGNTSIVITDNGGGSTIEVSVGEIQITQLGPVADLSVLGVPTADDGFDAITTINSSANDTLLRRTSDTLNWGLLTAGMFPTSLTLSPMDLVVDGFLAADSFTVTTGPVTLPNNSIADAALSDNVALLNASNIFTHEVAGQSVVRFINTSTSAIAYQQLDFTSDDASLSIYALGTNFAGGQRIQLATRGNYPLLLQTNDVTRITVAGDGSEFQVDVTLLDFNGLIDNDQGVALGGGAAATLGTIGGSGPATAAQAQWLEIAINGTNHWIPVWT